MHGPLVYLSRLCRRWGGRLELLSEYAFTNQRRSPGWTTHPNLRHAIWIVEQRIIADRDEVNAGAVIHEMGHVFLREGDTTTTYEPDWLGWEIVLAQRAGCFHMWSDQNAGYNLMFDGEEMEWGSFDSTATARRVIADRIAYAKQIGIVSQDGEPLCTRGQ